MLKALADGETNPAALAALADQQLRATPEQLCDALGACPGSFFYFSFGRAVIAGGYCSFAYSALACFRMGMSRSASFQRVTKSL
jgi:hypothetical protein